MPLFAMFRFKDGAAHLDDYGVQGDLTAYMDQFALEDATSAISLLVDGEGGDLGENSSKGSTKKRWKDRTAGGGKGGGKDDDLDEDDEDDDYDDYDDYDDDDAVPQKLVETDVTLDIKCRCVGFFVCFCCFACLVWGFGWFLNMCSVKYACVVESSPRLVCRNFLLCVCVFFYVTFLSTHAPHRVLYIDMEGRSDDQSIKFMIERMAPRRVAFVHGSLAAAAKLKTKLGSKATPKDAIFLPKRGDSIEMRSDTKTFQIKMDDSLLNSLRMKKIVGGDYEVARFRGVMRYPTAEELAQSAEASGGSASGEQDTERGDEGDAAAAAAAAKEATAMENRQMMLFAHAAEVAEGEQERQQAAEEEEEEEEEEDVVDGRSAKKEDGAGNEAGGQSSAGGGGWMGMGELKLSDLRTRLREVGVRAEIKPGGILVCEGNVAISKVGPHNFSMDGVVGEMYYRIRQVIYQVLTYVP